jgi:hypothetical protein
VVHGALCFTGRATSSSKQQEEKEQSLHFPVASCDTDTQMDSDAALASCLKYPKTENLRTDKPPHFTTTYKCEDKVCDFTKALKEISESTELQASRFKEEMLEIVKVFAKNYEKHLAHKCDGIRVTYFANPAIHLFRENASNNGRTILVEYDQFDLSRMRP